MRSPERDNAKPRRTLSRQLNRLSRRCCSCCLALACRERARACVCVHGNSNWNEHEHELCRRRCIGMCCAVAAHDSLYCWLTRTHSAQRCCCCSVCLLLLPSLAVNRFTLRAKLTLAMPSLLLQKFLALSVLSGILRPPRRAGQREQQQQHEQQQQQHKSALDSLVR